MHCDVVCQYQKNTFTCSIIDVCLTAAVTSVRLPSRFTTLKSACVVQVLQLLPLSRLLLVAPSNLAADLLAQRLLGSGRPQSEMLRVRASCQSCTSSIGQEGWNQAGVSVSVVFLARSGVIPCDLYAALY